MDKKMMAMGTTMLVLSLLEEEDLYGYQIIRLLEERSNRVFSLKEGTLYDYYGAAEPPVRCGVSHLSGPTEPPDYYKLL